MKEASKCQKVAKLGSEPEAGTSPPYRPVNTRQTEDYVQQLEEIFDNFKYEVKGSSSDALTHTISALKDHTTKLQFMGQVDTNAVLQCFSEPTCVTLRETLEPKWLQEMDP